MFKLLQWNICIKEDIDNIISELERFDADIVCIQELMIKDNDSSTIDKLKSVYPYIFYDIADNFLDGTSQANAILSKYEIVKTVGRHVQLPSDIKTDYSREGRIYVEADIKISDKIFHVGTTHLSYTDRFEETPLKDDEVARLIECLKMHNKNFIFTGDLNAVPTSKYVSMINEFMVNHDTSNTWTTKPFSYRGFSENELNYKLDYVFTSPDVNVLSAEAKSSTASDHLPIKVIFDI